MTNDGHITKYSATHLRARAAREGSRSDLARIDALTSDEIERAAADQLREDDVHPDWSTSIRVMPGRNKTALSLRLDPDLVDWFRATGAGYQTRINDVLRAYVQHRRREE